MLIQDILMDKGASTYGPTHKWLLKITKTFLDHECRLPKKLKISRSSSFNKNKKNANKHDAIGV